MSAEEVIHRYLPSSGTINVGVERNSKGYNWSLSMSRPIPDGSDPVETGHAIIGAIRGIEQQLAEQFGQQSSS